MPYRLVVLPTPLDCAKSKLNPLRRKLKGSWVQIGRIGVRLRNTSNQPPAWAKELVAARNSEPVFSRLSSGRSVALLPIKLQSQCLMCHGRKNKLHQTSKKNLQSLYPQDQATGFSEGELRAGSGLNRLISFSRPALHPRTIARPMVAKSLTKDHYQILILGGGTAGITVAAQLRRKLKTTISRSSSRRPTRLSASLDSCRCWGLPKGTE